MSEKLPSSAEDSRASRVGSTIRQGVRNTRAGISAICGEAFDLVVQTTGEAINKGANGLGHVSGKVVRSVGTGTVAFVRSALGSDHLEKTPAAKQQAA